MTHNSHCPTCGRGMTRSVEQNARMWAMLNEIAEHVVWYGEKLTAPEWKIVLSSVLARQKVVPGPDGGFVALGVSTSKLTKQQMSDLMLLIEAFGSEHGVEFKEAA